MIQSSLSKSSTEIWMSSVTRQIWPNPVIYSKKMKWCSKKKWSLAPWSECPWLNKERFVAKREICWMSWMSETLSLRYFWVFKVFFFLMKMGKFYITFKTWKFWTLKTRHVFMQKASITNTFTKSLVSSQSKTFQSHTWHQCAMN